MCFYREQVYPAFAYAPGTPQAIGAGFLVAVSERSLVGCVRVGWLLGCGFFITPRVAYICFCVVLCICIGVLVEPRYLST